MEPSFGKSQQKTIETIKTVILIIYVNTTYKVIHYSSSQSPFVVVLSCCRCHRHLVVRCRTTTVWVASDCQKLCHLGCFQGLLLAKYNLEPLLSGRVACNKAQKESSVEGEDLEGGRFGKWDSDGKNGADDPHTSMRNFLD
jgi:hypothetical protein